MLRARIDKTGFTFTVKLEPKGRWSTDIHVVTAVKVGGQQHTFSAAHAARRRRNMERELDALDGQGAQARV